MTNNQKEIITFEIRADIYKDMHGIIDSVTDRCGITFNKNGLSILTVDNANIAIGSLEIKKNSLVEYNFTQGQNPITMGFDMDKLKAIGLLEDYNRGNVRFTIFECKSNGKNSGTKTMCKVHHDIFNDTFELLPIGSVRTPKKMQTFKDTCSFTLDKHTLSKAIEHGANYDVGISIICNKSSMHFADAQSSEWTTDEIQIDETGEAKSTYSTQYLSDFIGAIPGTTPIEFKYKTDFPCEMKIEFAEGCTATWMIAPMLERV